MVTSHTYGVGFIYLHIQWMKYIGSHYLKTRKHVKSKPAIAILGRYRAWIVIIRIRCWKTMKDKRKIKRFVISVRCHAIYLCVVCQKWLWHCNFGRTARVFQPRWIWLKYDLLSIIIIYRFVQRLAVSELHLFALAVSQPYGHFYSLVSFECLLEWQMNEQFAFNLIVSQNSLRLWTKNNDVFHTLFSFCFAHSIAAKMYKPQNTLHSE